MLSADDRISFWFSGEFPVPFFMEITSRLCEYLKFSLMGDAWSSMSHTWIFDGHPLTMYFSMRKEPTWSPVSEMCAHLIFLSCWSWQSLNLSFIGGHKASSIDLGMYKLFEREVRIWQVQRLSTEFYYN